VKRRATGSDERAWSLVYEGYDPANERLREALCTLGNGYFATRGASTDARADAVHYPGTYVAGGYNRRVSRVAGREVENEDLVNMPSWLPLTFRIDDGPWFRVDDVEILSYRQELDLKRAVLLRDLRFRDAEGRTTRWRERRLVSMADPHLAALSVAWTAEDWSGHLVARSGLDGGVRNCGVARYHALESRHLDVLERSELGADAMFLRCRTNQSSIEVALAARTRVYRKRHDLETARETHTSDDGIWQELSCPMRARDSVTVEKIVALHTSRDATIAEVGLEAKERLAHVERFDDVCAAHELTWRHLWRDFDIELEDGAAPENELKLRVHIFHLLQTSSHHSIDLDVGIPARGWHGEAYRGHIFWDELFIFPYLTLRIPTLTRALLRYRYRRLGAARRAALEAGYEGAMFPWQSGSTGREETQQLHLNPRSGRWIPDNSHRQHHINSAIAYNVWQYHQSTDDHEFLHAYGAEMFLEIARFWASIAEHDAAIDRYEIKGVMGPDEYHTAYPGTDPSEAHGIDNNAYTNVMASWVLMRALHVLELVPRDHRAQLCERIGLDLEETERWYEISRKLRVPFHGDGIISQFEGYDALEELDWDAYRAKYGNVQRLDRILEAENDDVNRFKASKQADVLMLFYLFTADELRLVFEHLGYPFEPASIPRNVDYYLARTSHGSTLSGVAHSWVLARSDRRGSWCHFLRALDSDVEDTQEGTTAEGIHVGAMAGTVDLIQRCYIGIEMRANILHFDPSLPDDLRRIRVRIRYRRHVLVVDVDHDRLRIDSLAVTSVPVRVAYRGQDRELAPGDRCEFRLLRPEDRDRDENRRSTPVVSS
jgi:alpha,alpha-trehalase